MQWVILNDSISHSGVKGMHWYERRYQNPDGTWTALGKRRRREMSPDAQKRAKRKNEIKNLKSKSELDSARTAYKVNKAQNRKAVQDTLRAKIKNKIQEKADAKKEKRLEQTNEEIIRSGDIAKVLRNKEKLSNEELKAAAERFELERRLKDVSEKKKQDGANAYKRFADTVNTTANLSKNGINIYNNIASILNTFKGTDLAIIKTDGKKQNNPNQSQHDDDD